VPPLNTTEDLVWWRSLPYQAPKKKT